MICGIGVDIVEIDRVQKLLHRFGDRIAHRLLTDGEMAAFKKRNGSAAFLASRFAAKEAASKALGTGIAKGIGFHSIEVVSGPDGKPELVFHEKAHELLQQRSIDNGLLSLSDEKHYCVAMVVLESAG